jgi:hypothetical protein
MSSQPTNWLFRVGNGVELFNSSIFNTWGIIGSNPDSKFFLKKPNLVIAYGLLKVTLKV